MPHVTFLFNVRRESDVPEVVDGQLSYFIDGSEVGWFPVQISFKGRPGARTIIEFEGFVVPKPGLLTVKLLVNNETVAELEIFVGRIEVEKTKVRESKDQGTDTDGIAKQKDKLSRPKPTKSVKALPGGMSKNVGKRK